MAEGAWRWRGGMRHGQAFRPGMAPEERAPASWLTTVGRDEALAVGHRFTETLAESEIEPGEVVVVCAPSPEATETATVLVESVSGGGSPLPLSVLDPAEWPPGSAENARSRWEKIDAEILEELGELPPVVVVVGHDPQASWLLHDLVERDGHRQRGAGPLPLARGELAMVGAPVGEPLALRWVLSPSDAKAIAELQAKIKSKMDAAKLLGTFLTALLVFAARELAAASNVPTWYPWVAGLGVVFLAMGTAAYFLTMFHYDTLLMPVRFWPSPRRVKERLPRGFVRRPPSSAAWVLYQNMMRVWVSAFIPATLLGGAGAIAVAVALVRPSGLWWLAVALSIAATGLVAWWLWHRAQPNLGVSD